MAEIKLLFFSVLHVISEIKIMFESSSIGIKFNIFTKFRCLQTCQLWIRKFANAELKYHTDSRQKDNNELITQV